MSSGRAYNRVSGDVVRRAIDTVLHQGLASPPVSVIAKQLNVSEDSLRARLRDNGVALIRANIRRSAVAEVLKRPEARLADIVEELMPVGVDDETRRRVYQRFAKAVSRARRAQRAVSIQ